MNNSNRSFLAACGAAGVVLCAGLVGLAALGAGVYLFLRPAQTGPVAGPTPVADPAALPTSADPAAVSGPTALDAQLDVIQGQVAELRGLPPIGAVQRTTLTPEQLRAHVEEDFLQDYTADEARDDALTLVALGLLDPGVDLYGLYLDFLSDQVAGFYDDETKQIYVVQGAGFGGPERLTYAHEYGHALQDQHYGLEALGFSDEACEADSEKCAAVQALIEGDATLIELQWLTERATPEDYQQVLDFANSYESSVYDSAPEFLKKDFGFPYDAGYAFVQYLYDLGGWPAVDEAYRGPPVSTEQILHPERYPSDAPQTVTLPPLDGVLGPGWREVDADVVGEWYTRLILEAHLPEPQAALAAEGWGGDAYRVYHADDPARWVLVMHSVWDTGADAQEFARAFTDYAGARFNGPALSPNGDACRRDSRFGLSCLRQVPGQTLWIMAPDEETLVAVLAEVRFSD